MRKFRSSPFIFISIFISIIFYFDLKLMIGTDNSWYLDMAYALNSKLKFLKDLYDYKFKTVTQPNPHQLLFQTDSFSSFNPNPDVKTVGSGIFLNSTRVQVRDMTKQTC